MMEKIKKKRFLRYFISACVLLIFVFVGLWPGTGGDNKDIWDEMKNWRRKSR